MSPGLPVEKFVLSHSDLKHHREDVHSYSTADIVTAMSKESGFETAVRNLKSKKHETLRDLLCFGNGEVSVSLCSIYPVPAYHSLRVCLKSEVNHFSYKLY